MPSKTNRPDFSIIIPNYNGAAFLTSCLESLLDAVAQCPHTHFEVILVDNGSVDNSADIFKNYFLQKNLSNLRSTIYYLQSNQGFAGAVNKGIKESSYTWVILLNNDLTMNSDWLKLVSDAISNNTDPKLAALAGTVLSKDGSHFESQGLAFDYRGKCQNISNGQVFDNSRLKIEDSNIWGASAALIVYQKNALKEIDYFDEDFFAYEEDVDVALRLHKLNYTTRYIPQAISYHLGGGTSSRMGNFRNRMDTKNWFFIIIKNYTAKEIISNLPLIIEERLRNLSGLVKNTPISQLIPTLFNTYSLVFSKLPTMFAKRRQFSNLLKSIQQ